MLFKTIIFTVYKNKPRIQVAKFRILVLVTFFESYIKRIKEFSI